MEAFREELRESGGSIHWLDEVDDRPIDTDQVQALGDYGSGGRFANPGSDASDPPASKSSIELDDGRNPLYRDAEEDSDAKAEREAIERRFDYDAWREDPQRYEADRARP